MSRQPFHPHGQPPGAHGAPPPPMPRPVLPQRDPWWKAMWACAAPGLFLIVVGVVLVVMAAPDDWNGRVNPDHEPLFLTGMILGIIGMLFGCLAVPVCWVIYMVKRAT